MRSGSSTNTACQQGTLESSEMSVAYARPFHPLDLANRAAAVFALGDMIDQLRHEEVYRSANRNALTLIHDAYLTAVLTVTRAGAECEDHFSQEPTVFIVLEGELAIESADGGIMYLPGCSAGALARDVRHKLTASTDCAYLMVMGRQDKAEKSAGARRSMNTDLLAADMSSTRSQANELQRSGRLAPLNFASEAFLLALAGLILLFILPPAAAIVILLSILIAVGGTLRALASRGTRVGGRLLRLRASHAHRSSH
jgi:hypothetical protein